MDNIIIGIFPQQNSAEEAISRLEVHGYDPSEVTVATKNRERTQEITDNTGATDITLMEDQSDGEVVGILTEVFDLPDDAARRYERDIQNDNVLVAVPVMPGDEEEVRVILSDSGAENIKSTQGMNDQPQSSSTYQMNQSQMQEEGKMKGSQIVNPVQVEKFLKNVDYPATKDILLETAKKEGADERVLDTLNMLPDREYDSPIDISEEIGALE